MSLVSEIREIIFSKGLAIFEPWIGREHTKKELLAALLAGRKRFCPGAENSFDGTRVFQLGQNAGFA